MKRSAAAVLPVLCLFGLSPSALAQKPAATPAGKAAATAPAAAPIPPSKAAAVQELFAAMKLQEEVKEMPDAMINAELSRNPGMAPFRDVMVKWLKKYMTWPAMAPEITKLYAQTYSEDELKQMAAFYRTPTGQKALRTLPELMQRTAMIGAQLGQPHQDELQKEMQARGEELKKQEEKKAAAGGAGKAPAAPTKKP